MTNINLFSTIQSQGANNDRPTGREGKKMIMTKENVIIYTVQLDTEAVRECSANELRDLFKAEFEREGMTKEAELMDKGGFSFRETERNSYYTEYKISITTRRKVM